MKRGFKEKSRRFEELHHELKILKESNSCDGDRFNEILSEMESLANSLGFNERAVIAHAKGESEYWEGLEEFFQFEEEINRGE